ncbi:MAG: glutathione S-transferase C-terminal domain-containing protein, partial [Gluconacetobacter diazotrophicus]|nr:glutathione S-transferase C-terminal domain-containing protein [Gluconacetobacter diazotrophicus]
ASPSGMVPVLHHRDAVVWDSLAIGEYCAEIAPELWPEERAARAWARAVAAEMHSGFRALRVALPMNTGRQRALVGGLPPEVAADAARITRIWEDTRDRFGADGPFLFGSRFTLADAMFAPVVIRFGGYEVALDGAAGAYAAAVRAHPLLERWHREAAAEPADWRLEKYESVS